MPHIATSSRAEVGRNARAACGRPTVLRRRGRSFVLGLCAVVSLSSAQVAGACTVSLDQANLVSSGNLGVALQQSPGQMFTAGVGGDLVGIEVAPLLDSTPPGVTIFLDLYRGSTFLGTVTRTTTGFPPGSGVAPAPLSAATLGPGSFDLTPLGVIVVPGDQLGFVIRHSMSGVCDLVSHSCIQGRSGRCEINGHCNPQIRVGVSGDTYAGGQATVNGSLDPGRDLAFKSLVCVPDVSTTTTTLPPDAADHYFFYKVRTTSGTPPFVKFGPVALADQFGSAGYDVVKPLQLGLPADKNGEGTADDVTHLEAYGVKPVAGTSAFATLHDVQIANQCNTLRLEVKSPFALLVPANKGIEVPVPAPDPTTSRVDHYLCYRAKAQTKRADGSALPKFPKGIQVVVADQFQTRRYDLKKITRLCNPVGKSGTPVFLAGPQRGMPFPIAAATIRRPDDHLVCYLAKLATKEIPQTGCGPTAPGAKGTPIAPSQPKHMERIGLFVNDQFGPERLDSVKEAELCIPSTKALLPP